MDEYFNRSDKGLPITDLHLVGVASIFMACKYEEIYPVKLSVVYEKIAHKKISVEQILKKEGEIL